MQMGIGFMQSPMGGLLYKELPIVACLAIGVRLGGVVGAKASGVRFSSRPRREARKGCCEGTLLPAWKD